MSNTVGQIDLTDKSKTFHPIAAEYTFFLSAHRTFSGVDHKLVHKTGLNKFKKLGTIPSIFDDYNGIKLEINNENE